MLDGTQEAEQKAKMMLSWDVSNGVSHIQALPRAFSPGGALPLQTADPRESSAPFFPQNSPATLAYRCLLSHCCWVSPCIFLGCF